MVAVVLFLETNLLTAASLGRGGLRLGRDDMCIFDSILNRYLHESGLILIIAFEELMMRIFIFLLHAFSY